MKSCKTCSIVKSLTEFYKRSNRPSYREECKICYNITTMNRHKVKPRSREANRISAAKFRLKNSTYYHGQYAIAKKRNPGKLRAQWARRKANKKQAIPKWLTEEQRLEIVKIYTNCPKGFHVDHIIPISGKEVKGLHVPWNLQYLLAIDNIKKSNKLLEKVG